MTVTYPELTELSQRVPDDCVVDGEIVAFGPDGNPEFGVLQHRSKLTKPRDVEREQAKTPVYLMVFDVLNVDGESLLRTPYEQRRERLFDTVSEGDPMYVPAAFGWTLDAGMGAGRERKLAG